MHPLDGTPGKCPVFREEIKPNSPASGKLKKKPWKQEFKIAALTWEGTCVKHIGQVWKSVKKSLTFMNVCVIGAPE